MKAWHVVVVVAAVALGLGGYHACNVYRVEALASKASHRLDDITQVRGVKELTGDMVTKRVVERLSGIGIRVRPEDVTVRIAPVTRDNEATLSLQARKALAIARKIPNHGVQASVLILDVKASVRRGQAMKRLSIHRTYLVTGPARPTESDADESEDEGNDSGQDDEAGDE